jgi:hypothetical protein
LINIKIGSFEFSKPPDIFKEHGGIFFVSGSLPIPDDAKRLKKLLTSGQVLDFEYEGRSVRVLVGDQTFSHDVIWGERYELLLHKYNKLELTRRKISNGEIENIGEKMLSPRFKVTAEQGNWKEILPRGEIVDYEVQIRVDSNDKGQSFKVMYKDQYPVEKARRDFSKWTVKSGISVEISLGYLEQGDLLSVAKGKIERISNGIVKSCNWIRLEGHGVSDERVQESVYLIKEGENLVTGHLERAINGSLTARVKTFLLPDLKPKDSIDVFSKNLGLPNIEMAKVNDVTHIFESNGALTEFTFAPKAST